ncbi:cation:proton antiporter [Streptomyces sp. NBC_01602]|uniref:cation:proton antiporter domain-containing protein n=1 Tax=Streptomyces sp. NBC_01602 TaxID=2975893 RepID=UPI00386A84CA
MGHNTTVRSLGRFRDGSHGWHTIICIIVLTVAAGVPFLLAMVPRVPIPGPVLEIVAGIVLGPAILNVVEPDATVQALSIIGLSFLLFLSGLEIDIQRLRARNTILLRLPGRGDQCDDSAVRYAGAVMIRGTG